MNTLQIFKAFLDNYDVQVRISMLQDNEPLFCLIDVAKCLGIANHHDLSSRLESDEKDDLEILDAIGRLQKTTFITEVGLYRIIMSCQSSNQKVRAFQRWVCYDVLPSIRKTGSYSTSVINNNATRALTAQENAEIELKVWMNVSEILGCPKHTFATEAVKLVAEKTGFDFTPALLASPVMDNIKSDEVMLEPTELGKVLGLTAIQMNRALENAGLQRKFGKIWQVTTLGDTMSSKHAWKYGSKTGYNYKWNVEKVRVLLEELNSKA